MIKQQLRKLSNALVSAVCRREFSSQVFQGFNERSVEYRFVFEEITRHCPRDVLDVGTGKSALPQLMRNCGALVTAIDNIHDYWPKGMANRHYHVIQDNILNTKLPKSSFDLITCISVLEHIPDHDKAVRSMVDLLKPGARLLLSFPYNEQSYQRNVYAMDGSIGSDVYPFETQVFSREQLDGWCHDNAIVLVKQEWWRFFDGEFWTVGKPVCPPEQTGPNVAHQIACVVLQKDLSR